MFINPADLTHRERYRLLTTAIVPRPVAWVSSMDAAGRLNLAPFSYFTAVATNPLTLLFCPQVSARTGRPKDTLVNVQAVPEFVVNLINEELAGAMNLTAAELPPGRSEFELAGVTPAASRTISVPRVAEAPAAFECTLQQIVTVGTHPGGGAAVFGRVQYIHIRDDLWEAGQVALNRLKPVGRLGGAGYVRVTDIFEMQRPLPPQEDGPRK